MKIAIAIIMMVSLFLNSALAEDLPADLVVQMSKAMNATTTQSAVIPHVPNPPTPNCQCGCTETGQCTCKDCDHPALTKPTVKSVAPLTKGNVASVLTKDAATVGFITTTGVVSMDGDKFLYNTWDGKSYYLLLSPDMEAQTRQWIKDVKKVAVRGWTYNNGEVQVLDIKEDTASQSMPQKQVMAPPVVKKAVPSDNELIITKLEELSKRLDGLEVKCENCKVPNVTNNRVGDAGGISYVVISSSNCPPCEKLRSELLANAQSDDFPDGVIYKDDTERENHYGNITAYPTIILLRNGVEVSRHIGYMSAAQLIEWKNNLNLGPQSQGLATPKVLAPVVQSYVAAPQRYFAPQMSYRSFSGACVGNA